MRRGAGLCTGGAGGPLGAPFESPLKQDGTTYLKLLQSQGINADGWEADALAANIRRGGCQQDGAFAPSLVRSSLEM